MTQMGGDEHGGEFCQPFKWFDSSVVHAGTFRWTTKLFWQHSTGKKTLGGSCAMDFREPLLGGPNNFASASSPRITARRKSDLSPILSLISPRRTSSPLPTTYPSSPSQVNQPELWRGSAGGPESQVGSVSSRRFLPPLSETSTTTPSPASLIFLGQPHHHSSLRLQTPDLSGGGATLLSRIPEEPYDRFPEQQPFSLNEAEDQEQQRASRRQGNNEDESDLGAPASCPEESSNAYYDDEGNDSCRGVFGEPLTDDAQETTKEEKEKEDRYSWKTGFAGLLGMVPLLPSLPDILNPFSESTEDDFVLETKYARCDSCKLLHAPDKTSGEEAEQQNGQTTPKKPGVIREFIYSSLPSLQPVVEKEEQIGQTTPRRSGGLRKLIISSLPIIHSLPNLFSEPCSEEHSLDYSGAGSPRGPVKVVSIKEDFEAQYAPVSDPCHLPNCVGKIGKRTLRKCRTAPMLTGLVSNGHAKCSDATIHSTAVPRQKSASSIVWQATTSLFIYLSIGVIVYTWKREEFTGIETVGVVDALYFCIVTMCTIGYGDITPTTPSAKILACALVFVGFGFVDALMSGMLTFVLDRQEHLLLNVIEDGHHERYKNVFMDCKKGRMRIRMKVALAVGTVLCAMTVGVLVLHYMEELPWIDAIYATCISITTVGYGDVSFQTMSGRLFAAVWLLLSTLGVARAFLFLAEARVHSRHRHLAKRVLQRKVTTNDLMAMDLDNDGHVSKSEFVVYKLKEMGRIEENDVVEICQQFDYIDKLDAGKITLAQLLEAEFEERGKTS